MSSSEVTLDLARRVFLVATDAMRAALAEELSGAGFAVKALVDEARLADEVIAFKPDLVVIEEYLAKKTGRQLVLSLRSNGATFPRAIVGVLTDVSVPNILEWIKVGATDVWKFPFTKDSASRTRALIDELDRTQAQLAPAKTRLIAFAARARLTGTARVFAGTPFEGVARFSDGELQEGRFGSLSGDRALEQMLQAQDGPVGWEEGASTEPFVPVVEAATTLTVTGFKARVLVIEDDVNVRKLLTKQLESAGYEVEGSGDGRSALQTLTQRAFDVVVADLDLPHLDGWGVLRELRSDVVQREISVMVLSAHEEAVDTLKASRAGARAYLKKSGKSRQLLDAMDLLIRPRAKVWGSLKARRDVKIETRAVGPLWLLRTLAELDCNGRLELEDQLGRSSVVIAQGQLVRATATRGSELVRGVDAVASIVGGRGEGMFHFEKQTVPPDARWLYEAIDSVCARLRREENVALTAALEDPGSLFVNEDLAQMFSRKASVTELLVLEAIRLAPADLPSLVAATQTPREDVEVALSELLRRGVLTPTGDAG